jgi:hypothetical protein
VVSMADIEKCDDDYEDEVEDDITGRGVQSWRASHNWEKLLMFIWVPQCHGLHAFQGRS